MKTEDHYLERVEGSAYFRATEDIFDPCIDCGCAIIPGEPIAETSEGEYIHLSCLEAAWEN